MGCLQRSLSCFVAALCSVAALESCPQALPASARVRLLRERRDDVEFLDDFDDTRYTVLLKLLRAVEFFAAHASGPTHWGRIDDDSYAFVDRVAAGLLAPERIKLAPDTKDDAFSADEFVWSFFMERSDFHAAPFAVGFGSIMTAGLARHLAAASLDFGFGRRGDLVAHNRDDGCDIGEANDVGVDTRRTGGCFMERFWDDDIFLGMVLWPLKHARLHAGQEKRAKFPTSKAPISAVFHSFRLIFGRATISRNGSTATSSTGSRARRPSPRGIGPDSIIVNGLVASAGEFEKTFKGDYFGVNADVSSSVGNDQWNGPVSSFQPSEFDVYDKMGRYVGWRMHYNDQAYDITVARDCDERHYSNAALCAMLCDTGNQHFDVSSCDDDPPCLPGYGDRDIDGAIFDFLWDAAERSRPPPAAEVERPPGAEPLMWLGTTDPQTGEYTNRPMWKACELLEDDGDRACDAAREGPAAAKRLAGLSDRLLDRQAKKRSTDWLTECGAALHDRAGELKLLEALHIDVRVEFVCAATEAQSIQAVPFATSSDCGTSSAGSGAVLFHGGGNMGDLYAGYEHFRWAALEALPDYRLVVLPNTVIYDDANLSKLENYRRHGNLTLFARDAVSHGHLEKACGGACAARLAPDSAFALADTLAAATGQSKPPLARSKFVETTDQVSIANPTKRSSFQQHHRVRASNNATVAARRTSAASGASASNAVGAGDVVITDRLHGVIIATLLGRPAVALDTTNRKVSRFARTWLVPDGAADAAAACLVVADPDAPDADARASTRRSARLDRLSFDTSIGRVLIGMVRGDVDRDVLQQDVLRRGAVGRRRRRRLVALEVRDRRGDAGREVLVVLARRARSAASATADPAAGSASGASHSQAGGAAASASSAPLPSWIAASAAVVAARRAKLRR
ncbi:polysaccharide pyruvyl transferase [Aureococcus anophagefferens]|nr:polysaccharide pyruvyl transferase [Aureococcus anophagefferens]